MDRKDVRRRQFQVVFHLSDTCCILPIEQGEAPATILISVSKRRFKRAVKRNRVKRQIREVYRKNKLQLLDDLQSRGQRLAIAFIYLSDELVATAELEEKMKIALSRISEKLSS